VIVPANRLTKHHRGLVLTPHNLQHSQLIHLKYSVTEQGITKKKK